MINIQKLILESYLETIPDASNNGMDDDTPLFGGKGVLDSLGLVSFLISLEQKIEDNTGISLTIADEKAMSLKNSPFKTIGTLHNYLKKIINEHK